jgi:hypothetical protein
MLETAVQRVTIRDLAVEVHGWAQDILRTNETCGLGRSLQGKYVVIWPGLISQWIHCPDEHGEFLGTLDRRSGVDDVMALLEGGA